MESQGTWNSQNNLKREGKVEGSTFPNLKTYYKATVIKTVWYLHKADIQTNGIERPEINPPVYGKTIYNKGAKTIQWEKDDLFNKWCWDICV